LTGKLDIRAKVMETIMKIRPQGQIRLPKKMLASLKIDSGDHMEVDLSEGQKVLKPRKLIDPTQSWYWTEEWQKKEAEAEEDSKMGRVSPRLKVAKEGLKWLRLERMI
jgi:hypothetical protein